MNLQVNKASLFWPKEILAIDICDHSLTTFNPTFTKFLHHRSQQSYCRRSLSKPVLRFTSTLILTKSCKRSVSKPGLRFIKFSQMPELFIHFKTNVFFCWLAAWRWRLNHFVVITLYQQQPSGKLLPYFHFEIIHKQVDTFEQRCQSCINCLYIKSNSKMADTIILRQKII